MGTQLNAEAQAILTRSNAGKFAEAFPQFLAQVLWECLNPEQTAFDDAVSDRKFANVLEMEHIQRPEREKPVKACFAEAYEQEWSFMVDDREATRFDHVEEEDQPEWGYDPCEPDAFHIAREKIAERLDLPSLLVMQGDEKTR